MSDDKPNNGKIPASVYIITLNEAPNIQRVLESVRDFDEIVIVDSGSTDGTLDLAVPYTQRIIHQDWLGYAGQKRFSLAQCSHEWVLNLDADEQLTPELQDEMVGLMMSDAADGLDIPIVDHFLGRRMHAKANSRIRFFKKALGSYQECEVHESIQVNGRVLSSQGQILHYSHRSIEWRMDKLNRYSSLRATEKYRKGKAFSLAKLALVMPVMFFKSYLLRRGYRDGIPGVVNAMMMGYYAFLKEAKLYELRLPSAKD